MILSYYKEGENMTHIDSEKKKKKRIALQGEIGSFSEMAALKYFGDQVEILPCNHFRQVFKKVKEKEADYAILPIENSQTGGINHVHDLLLHEDLYAIGEVMLRIEHCLIALPGVEVQNISTIYSHPQALSQCEQYLSDHFPSSQIIPVYDTAGSVKVIKQSAQSNAAGIASSRAAYYYGMNILKHGIEDNTSNTTRFLVFHPEIQLQRMTNKTSIIFAVVSVPGAIYKCLKEFALRNINLSRLESRPSKRKPWEYLFYLDFEEGLQKEQVQHALSALEKCTTFVKVIGTYYSDASILDEAKQYLKNINH